MSLSDEIKSQTQPYARKFTKGDKVRLTAVFARAKDEGIVWTIGKVNPTTYALVHPHGAQGVRAAHYMVEAVTEAEAAEAKVSPVVEGSKPLHIGAVVTVTGIPKVAATQQFVVLKDNAETVRLVKLGGDNGRYYPKVPRRMVTEVH